MSAAAFTEDDLRRLRTADRPELLAPGVEGSPATVALLAGSFDPVTVGHLALAEAAAEAADVVLLVYAVKTLPKGAGAPPQLLDEPERLRVLAAVCRARGPWLVPALCSHGLLADQVAAAADRFTGSALAIVAGSDKLLQLVDPSWYQDRDAALAPMLRAAEVWFAVRTGDDERVRAALARPENRAVAGRVRRLAVAGPAVGVSSGEVRELARRGRDVSGLVPAEAVVAVVRAAASS